MCREVIKESKIRKVYYYTESEKIITNKVEYIKIDDKNNHFSSELKAFFKYKR